MRGWQDPVPPVRLLVDADVVRQPTEEVQLPLDESEDSLRRDEKADVSQTPNVPNGGAAQVAQQAGVGDEEGDGEHEK